VSWPVPDFMLRAHRNPVPWAHRGTLVITAVETGAIPKSTSGLSVLMNITLEGA